MVLPPYYLENNQKWIIFTQTGKMLLPPEPELGHSLFPFPDIIHKHSAGWAHWSFLTVLKHFINIHELSQMSLSLTNSEAALA